MIKYKISEISKITNVIPSRIRTYERLNFIEPAERLDNGYRMFTDKHILQIKICHFVFREYINKNLRKSAMKIIEASIMGDISQCIRRSEEYILLIQLEIQKVNDVLDIIQKWNNGKENNIRDKILYTQSEAAEIIGTTKDSIRNWERNGLLNHYFELYQKRLYTKADIERMKIIYMLLQTGYSIVAIYTYLNELDQHNETALQILIDPVKDENIINCHDRYFQVLSAENERWIEMLEFLNEYEKK